VELRTRLARGLTLLVLAAAVPAQAFDATGTWKGGYSCKGFDGGPFKVKAGRVTMLVSQSGSTLSVVLDNANFHFAGASIDDAGDSQKGQAILVECRTDDVPSTGFAEMIAGVVKTKAGKDAASFKGTSVYQEVDSSGTEGGSCFYTFKRTSRTDPGVPGCL